MRRPSHPRHRFLAAGDAAVIVEFGDTIEPQLSREVLAVDAVIQASPPPGFITSVATFRSVTVQFDPIRSDPMAVKTHLEKLLLQPRTVGQSQQSSWRIPACYESDLAPDLAAVAARTGVTPENYADLHARQSYMVYMVGGFPGYPHMGDLPDRLRVPRLDSPRTRVPPGSICVAGQLTAIYPMPTPGGWNLIGRTPVRIFDATQDPPALLSPGDIVRFRSISRQEFDRIERDVSAGAWDYASLRSAGSCDPD